LKKLQFSPLQTETLPPAFSCKKEILSFFIAPKHGTEQYTFPLLSKGKSLLNLHAGRPP
jgi:hypothetical protein